MESVRAWGLVVRAGTGNSRIADPDAERTARRFTKPPHPVPRFCQDRGPRRSFPVHRCPPRSLRRERANTRRSCAIQRVFRGGGEGIRTPGTLRYGGFQNRCLRPLGHSSNCPYFNYVFRFDHFFLPASRRAVDHLLTILDANLAQRGDYVALGALVGVGVPRRHLHVPVTGQGLHRRGSAAPAEALRDEVVPERVQLRPRQFDALEQRPVTSTSSTDSICQIATTVTCLQPRSTSGLRRSSRRRCHKVHGGVLKPAQDRRRPPPSEQKGARLVKIDMCGDGFSPLRAFKQ
jgi:hypothetical protein